MTNFVVDKALTDICICTLQVLITLWNLTPLRNSVKKEGWEHSKEIADEYGHAPPTPRLYGDITIPRGYSRLPHLLSEGRNLGRYIPTRRRFPKFDTNTTPVGLHRSFLTMVTKLTLILDNEERRIVDETKWKWRTSVVIGKSIVNRREPAALRFYRPLTQTVSGLKKNQQTLKWTRVKRKCINYKELKAPQRTHGCKVI